MTRTLASAGTAKVEIVEVPWDVVMWIKTVKQMRGDHGETRQRREPRV